MIRRLMCLLLLGASALPAAARAAQAAPGFPVRLNGPVTTAITVGPEGPDGLARFYFGLGSALQCLTAAGRPCDGFPVSLGERTGLVGGPAIGDLDGDARPEIAAALTDGRLVLLRPDGAPVPGFSFAEPSGFEAGPSFADLDRDGRLELIAGGREGLLHALDARGSEREGFPRRLGEAITSVSSSGLLGAPGRTVLVNGNENGKVFAVDRHGATLPGFPVSSAYMVSGQPSLGDLDGDGFNEILFASQDFKVYAVRHDGAALPGFPYAARARLLAGPALADVDGDAKLDLVVGCAEGRLHAVDAEGKPLKGYPAKLGERVVGATLVADLDRDGKQELIAATVDGQLHVLRATGKPYPGFPAKLPGEATSGPAIAQGGDGNLIVAVPAGGMLHAFRVKRQGKDAAPLAWPEPGHDASHSGRVQPNPPRYIELAISPASPSTEDALGANYRFFDLDGDPEPALVLRWYRDGKEVPELAGKRVVPKELTRKKERWSFEVGGPAQRSPAVVVANSKPSAPAVSLRPEVLRRSGPVEAVVDRQATDADGDVLRYGYRWLKNGELQKGLSGPALPPGTVRKGERWTVAVTAFDGEDEGPAATAEEFVEDSAPTSPEIAFSPAHPRTVDPVRVVIEKEAGDVDGDALRYRYRFSVDGVALPLASTLDTLPPLIARKKQVVSVEVRADDGELLGPPVTLQATIRNTVPSAPVAAVVPAEPRTGQHLAPGLDAPSLDPDGDPLAYRFGFSRDGKRLPSTADGRELAARRGEVYELEAVASDGEADSAPGKAAVTVRNTPPTPPVLAFEALPLRRIDAVRVKVLEPSRDADGDAVRYRWEWSKDGQLQKGFAGPELPAGTVRKAERWTVSAIPSDGLEEGPAARLEAVVGDSPPTAPEVALEPASPRVDQPVKAVIRREASDPDGDRLRYHFRFAVDGTPVAQEQKVDTLPARAARKKQVVWVQVQADDGEQLGPAAQARTAVVNTPPEPPQIALGSPVRTGDSLFGSLIQPARDADGDRVSYRFAFYRDGVKLPAAPDPRAVATVRAGETYEFEVVASDGEADAPAVRAKTTVLNGAPTPPAVSFTNATPRAGEAVDVRIDRPASDPDGEPVVLRYQFRVGGKPSGLPEAARAIPAGRLKKHESWTVEVVPHDGHQSGPAGSARLEVLNSKPTAPRVAIEPATPTALRGASAKIVEPASDRDGDTLTYRYAWYRDGVKLELPPGQTTLAPGTVRRGEHLRLEVVAFDGEVEGEVARASAAVGNSAPAAPQIALKPEKPTVRDEFRCTVRAPAQDPDQETPVLQFTWRRDGKVVPVASSQDRVPPGAARHGELWSCEVVATDGELSSAPVRDEAAVRDSAPSAPVAVVEPEEPRAGQDLRCRLARWAQDDDADALRYSFRWLQGSKPLDTGGGDPQVLPAALGRKGQSYRCEVVPADGSSRGPAAHAEGRYRNTPPSRPQVQIVPSGPAGGETLTCEVRRPATDPDGEKIRYKFLWLKNGAEQPFAASSAQVPGRLVKAGDLWRCSVTASDGDHDGPPAESGEVTVQAEAAAP